METNKTGFPRQEELDIRTLQSKNRKLAEMLDQRQAIEDELREHIEKLERRQATDDASLLIVNRYWSQVANSFICSDFYLSTIVLLSTVFISKVVYFVFSSLDLPFSSLMRTSVSSLNATTWSRVWEICSQKEKPSLYLNQSQTRIAIRNGKMTEREVRIHGGFYRCCCLGS